MKCHVCGAGMHETKTDLPFKISEHSIVVVRDIPVIQCSGCREFMLADDTMARLEELLEGVNSSADLEIIRFAA